MLGFAFCESFLCEMVTLTRSAKVFSLESFPLYGMTINQQFHTILGSVLYMYIQMIGQARKELTLCAMMLGLWRVG